MPVVSIKLYLSDQQIEDLKAVARDWDRGPGGGGNTWRHVLEGCALHGAYESIAALKRKQQREAAAPNCKTLAPTP